MFKKSSDRIVGTIDTQALLLFVGDPHHEWQITLDDASRTLGRLKTISLPDLEQAAMIYDLYILDATTIPNTPALIQNIRKRHNTARIIVMSDDSSWEKARAAFRAGAADCIQWDNNCRALNKILRENLQKQFGAGCG